MDEEAADAEYDRIVTVTGEDVENDDGRVRQWEIGLPSSDELTPLSQSLIPPELASVFQINPEPPRSLDDVHRASQNTISNLRRHGPSVEGSSSVRYFDLFPSHPVKDTPDDEDDVMVLEEEEEEELGGSKDADRPESSSRKVRRMDSPSHSSSLEAMEESEPSAVRAGISNDDQSAKTLKRTRLVWTPELHKRFVDVVGHLGIKNAVPKTIMQLMNVEGLTRENVASHLQKYRLYLKRKHGMPNQKHSAFDHLFALPRGPQSLHEQQVPAPTPYAVPSTYPMPMFGMAHPHGPGKHKGVAFANNHQVPGACDGFEPHHPCGAFGMLPKNWSGGELFGHSRVTPGDK